RFVMSHLPREWITRQIWYDYGLDLNVELVEDGRVTGKNFSVQVKSVKNRRPAAQDVRVRLTQATVAYMGARLEPVLLVAYVDEDHEAYWMWAEEIAIHDGGNETVTVRVPTARKLTQTNWDAFSEELNRYFRSRPLVDTITA